MIEAFKNPDGSYNGIHMLAQLSGLDVREVAWTANRLKQLMTVEHKSKDEARQIVATEAKGKPWM